MDRRDVLKAGVGIAATSMLSDLANAKTRIPSGQDNFNPIRTPLSFDNSDLNDNIIKFLVIGSGYGGSILAYRLALKFPGQVVLLEKGKEWFPGDFPQKTKDLASFYRNSVTNPLGLFDSNALTNTKGDLDIVGASGLGGTSLINAAISMKPHPEVFASKEWPAAIRNDETLDAYFQIASDILDPHTVPNWETFKKAKVHKKAIEKLGRKIRPLPLNIRFSKGRGKNKHGLLQDSCIYCGDCTSGCNVGSKNTLERNYLYLARKAGVRIYTRVEVETIKKKGNSYEIATKFYNKKGKAKNRLIS